MSDQPAPPPVNPPPVSQGLAFESMVTDVGDADKCNSIAIMGMYKTGKTTLAASIARVQSYVSDPSQVLILEAETGTSSIAKHYKGVKQFTIKTAQGFNRAIGELLYKQHQYKVIIVDTFDRFQELQTDYELALTPGDTRAAYRRLKKWTAETVWSLHSNTNFLVIFLFHEESEKDEATGKTITTYKLAGGAKKDLGQTFDIIARLTVNQDGDGNTQRMLQLAPSEGVVTGSRWENELPSTMANPTMAQIFDLIEAPASTDTTLTKE